MALSSPFEFVSKSATHVGSVRKLNEDSCLDRGEIGLWVVADGMGGHQAGDVASQMIVQTLKVLSPPADASGFIADVRSALSDTNQRLLVEASQRGPNAVVGSTVVVLLAHGNYFACLWAGDSRLYRFRADVLEQVSVDHSQVQELVDAGAITAEEAERHPLANVITRAVGTHTELVLDKVTDRLAPDDLFILCTDGLSKMVGDAEIETIVRNTPFAAVAQALVDAALEHGGKDNVTVIGVQVGDGATVPPKA